MATRALSVLLAKKVFAVILNPIMNASNRNKPCICGSNLKFKKCCGNFAKWQAQVRAKADELKAKQEAEKAAKANDGNESSVKVNPPATRVRTGLRSFPLVAAAAMLGAGAVSGQR